MLCDVDAELASLLRPSCMERHPARDGAATHQLPVYVIHHPLLRLRRQVMEARLAAAATASAVTWVLCANREDVDSLSSASRACLFQFAVDRVDHKHYETSMSNGTRSLALKHLLVYADVRRQGLPAALVFEDDAGVPPSLWQQFTHQSFSIPPDADIFWLGGGHQNRNLGLQISMHGVNASRYCGPAAVLKAISGLPPMKHAPKKPGGVPLYCTFRRDFGQLPHFIGAVAYVITQRGARAWRGWPVRGPADLVLSRADLLCRPRGAHAERPRANASAASTGGGASGSGHVPHANRTAAASSPACHLQSQYGPARWIVIQNHSGFGTSVRSHHEHEQPHAPPLLLPSDWRTLGAASRNSSADRTARSTNSTPSLPI